MKDENAVKSVIRKLLKTKGIQHMSVTTNGFGSSGWPDICFLYRGVFVGIECKFGKNKPSALQEQKLDYIKAQGGIALLVNEENVGDVEVVLSRIDHTDDSENEFGKAHTVKFWSRANGVKLWRD